MKLAGVLPALLLAFSQVATAADAPYRNASAFPIELEQQLHGHKVDVQAGSTDNMVYVRLQNADSQALQCSATFRNGPETPRTRRATIAPGKSAVLSDSVQRQVAKMRIRLECDLPG